MKKLNIKKILVSACLLGAKVRYDGKDACCEHPLLQQWLEEKKIIVVCPEILGGLPVPRSPCEIVGSGDGKAVLSGAADVMSVHGDRQTSEFLEGAKKTLLIAQQQHVIMAILKSNSPSCGNHEIYNGAFQSKKIPGMGVTAALLRMHNIPVFNEKEVIAARTYYMSLNDEIGHPCQQV